MPILAEEIKRDVVEQLYWDERVDASNISVQVRDHTVTLSGSVQSALARMSAEYDALIVEGVSQVKNTLRIAAAHTRPVPSAEEIATQLRKMFMWNPHFDAERITVSVNADRVVLSGKVDAYWKKIRAEELAYEIVSVTNVENLLTVLPRQSRPDPDIEHTINEVLSRNSKQDISSVDIEVRRGVVILTGIVPDYNTRVAIENAARYTPGVTNVVSKISIGQGVLR